MLDQRMSGEAGADQGVGVPVPKIDRIASRSMYADEAAAALDIGSKGAALAEGQDVAADIVPNDRIEMAQNGGRECGALVGGDDGPSVPPSQLDEGRVGGRDRRTVSKAVDFLEQQQPGAPGGDRQVGGRRVVAGATRDPVGVGHGNGGQGPFQSRKLVRRHVLHRRRLVQRQDRREAGRFGGLEKGRQQLEKTGLFTINRGPRGRAEQDIDQGRGEPEGRVAQRAINKLARLGRRREPRRENEADQGEPFHSGSVGREPQSA